MASQWLLRVLSQGGTGLLFFLPSRVFCEAVFTTGHSAAKPQSMP